MNYRRLVKAITFVFFYSLYDDDGRLIQMQSKIYGTGVDIYRTQYNFIGQPGSSVLNHRKSTNSSTITVATKNTIDELGRVVKIEKNINLHSRIIKLLMERYSMGAVKTEQPMFIQKMAGTQNRK
jgi:hypothetical protein